MKSALFSVKMAVGAVSLFTLFGAPASREAFAAPTQSANEIIVTRKPTTGVQWEITLPKGAAGHLQDQAWLVVDGQAEGLAGYDIASSAAKQPLTLYVNINSQLDGEVKDILKAQGFPVKQDMTVYRVSYGVNRADEYTLPTTLHFRHVSNAIAYNNDGIPDTARYKIGERIPLFSAVAWDSETSALKIFDSSRRAYPNLPRDLVHRITIEVQFLPMTPDGKIDSSMNETHPVGP